ncbi:alpha/beta hydrolase [Natrinema longum]|uniref:Dienelactone hydrolase family protein n=1 Tax=Natrinema longum TaxID=370324 RepID=A0A8A2UDB6_9EURY|nr:dienelactone hydrolase family protein [Natrinema longum]MBZ6495341.1 dienelactone hydrolase family protein [Natrinema longum]QSW86686.1 dienelactone hydrolase family protein [Natrinema longum]
MSAADRVEGPHQGQQLVTGGTDLADAEAALVCTHGRGATARGMVQMAEEFHRDGVAVLAPQAARQTWYPNSFLAPVERNEPGRSSGLRAIADAISRANRAGIPTERIMLIGFSQGACLASEYLVRNPRRYGGLAALSGGLIGEELDDEYPGDLEGTPVFLGCSDVDPHIPEERVHDTADVLESMNADVTKRLYEGMGHGINDDEMAVVSEMVAALLE